MNKFYFVILSFAMVLAIGCNVGDDSQTMIVGTGSGGGETATADAGTTTASAACAPACTTPEACGAGCATDGTVGCYTPGGNQTNPTKWDCPSCFATFKDNDKACGTAEGFPYAYSCQVGAAPIDGCVWSSTTPWYQCCPPGPDGGSP